MPNFSLYADNSSIILSDKDRGVPERKRNDLLHQLETCLSKHNLFLNKDKTELRIFHDYQKIGLWMCRFDWVAGS